MKAKPIIKWAGGKRQLISQLLEYMPKEYNTYFEPFVGGGALFLELLPKNAVINDVNSDLLSVYRCMSNDECFNLMLEELKKHELFNSKEYFYEIRELDRHKEFYNMPIWSKAARLIYLNKSCFNGLYRVNKNGYFNVPFGNKTKVNTYEQENITKIHQYFKENAVQILEGDFEKAVLNAKKGDFVYFDPPYDNFENQKNFTQYSVNSFTKEDQVRLCELFKELSNNGVYVMLSNHNTAFINELYKNYNIHIVEAKRFINCNSNGRGNVEEVIITNY